MSRSDVSEIESDIVAELRVLRDALQPVDGTAEDEALCAVETFVAVSLRVMAKTNPSKLRSEARNVEIQARMDGVPVVRGCSVNVFALDPGPVSTGWCIFNSDGQVADSGVALNGDVLQWVKDGQCCQVLAIEMIANMGMAVGATTFDTVRWIGRFQQAWHQPEAVKLVLRREVKTEICGNQRAKDGNIRQALIDRLGEPGVKKRPGPTYGVTSHAWSALAVAVTALERMGVRVQPKQGAIA